jgi:tripartite-type tricarboxylate transporter receptor subunit TctC
MMKQFAATLAALAGSALTLAAVTPAHAQSYPTKPVRLVVSVAHGGNLDLIGRSVADKASEGLKQRVIVENRPGANSTIGLSHVARSAPDGYTFVMIAQTFLIGPMMMRNAPFDPIRDFAPVSAIATLPQMLVVHPSLPARSVKELIAIAKARPADLNAGTSGNGSGSHLALERFNKMANVKIMRIPYNGDGPAIIDLLGGQVPVKFDNLSTSLTHVRAGKLRALGVTSARRTPLLPELPAISETLPGYESSIFNGMAAPAGTPPEILARMHAEIVKFTQDPETRKRFAAQGVELQASASPEQFATFLRNENSGLAKVLAEAGIKPE